MVCPDIVQVLGWCELGNKWQTILFRITQDIPKSQFFLLYIFFILSCIYQVINGKPLKTIFYIFFWFKVFFNHISFLNMFSLFCFIVFVQLIIFKDCLHLDIYQYSVVKNSFSSLLKMLLICLCKWCFKKINHFC